MNGVPMLNHSPETLLAFTHQTIDELAAKAPPRHVRVRHGRARPAQHNPANDPKMLRALNDASVGGYIPTI